MRKFFLICLLAVSLCGAVAAQTPALSGFVYDGGVFTDGTTLILGQTYTVWGMANADAHSVVFSKDGVTMKVDQTDPYSFTWAPNALGAHIIAARPWSSTTGTGIFGSVILVHYNVINATQTPTPTPTPTPTGTPTPSPIPTQSPTPTATPTPTGTPTPTISPTGTPTPTPTGSPTPSPTPTGTPSSTPIPTPTPIGGTKVVTFAWSGTADTLWYGAKSEAVVQNYTGVICAPATTCTGTAFPLSHSLVLPVGVQTVKVSMATGQHYFVVVSNAGGNSNLIEFDL